MFENDGFKRKRDVPKVYSFGPFLGPSYPRKIKNNAKNQYFARNYILKTIKWNKSQVPYKSHNSYIINKKKKNIFGAQNGPKLPPGIPPKGKKKS